MLDVGATLPHPERVAYAPCSCDKWSIEFYLFPSVEELREAIMRDKQKAPKNMGGDSKGLNALGPALAQYASKEATQ
jgi:hypothetical protein